MDPISTASADEENYLYAIQLTSLTEVSMVLKTAIELDLLKILAKVAKLQPLSPTEIASRLPSVVRNPDAPVLMDRILRLLASYNIVTCVLREQFLPGDVRKVERLYGPAPVCKFLTKNDGGVSLAPACLLTQGKVSMEACAHGMNTFEYAGTDQRFNKVFNQAMSNMSTIIMNKFLETSLVDVGGGIGVTIRNIVSKYPSIKGINFDLPHVIADAPLNPGVAHVGGDMFVSVPKGDAIFMKWICHDWSDEHCIRLLNNCYKAPPNDGVVIPAEFIMPLLPDSSLATKYVFHTDCNMFAYNPGGKVRTKEEFEALAKATGFCGSRVDCGVYGIYIIEFLKKGD